MSFVRIPPTRVYPGILPEVDDPNLYCKVRDKYFVSSIRYRRHLGSIHEMVLTRSPSSKFELMVYQKRIIRITIAVVATRRSPTDSHTKLTNVHKMNVIKPLQRVDLSILPDTDDPNFYCKVCKKTYNDKTAYRSHIRRVHEIKFYTQRKLPKYDPLMAEVDINDSKNKYCVICKLTFKEQGRYTAHMKSYNNRRFMAPTRGRSRIDLDVTPDIDDPNNYCKSCDFSFASLAV
jgi:hypothetical protein